MHLTRLLPTIPTFKAGQRKTEYQRPIPCQNHTSVTVRNAEEMSTLMLNEFVEKIVVHERDRKGSSDTTQKIEIYFNFIGEYVPPTMDAVEPTPEELAEIRKREARKDRLHQNYLKRKESGKQREYEERTKAKKKAQIDSQKEQIRAEDRGKRHILPYGSAEHTESKRGFVEQETGGYVVIVEKAMTEMLWLFSCGSYRKK